MRARQWTPWIDWYKRAGVGQVPASTWYSDVVGLQHDAGIPLVLADDPKWLRELAHGGLVPLHGL
jgi:hypothetical protein